MPVYTMPNGQEVEIVYDDNEVPPSQNFVPSVGNGGATNVQTPSYEALVDQIRQNNAWSAEQAERQMAFQERAWREQQDFNAVQAQANRDFQQESANAAMNFSAEEAQKNRDWQEMMSNSAHQREMDDLSKAGLNPILAARNGASTGTGASAVSAQAAGSQASSVNAPQGAKGDTDESGTMAIMSLLSRMLDNQIEREKMQNSAEIAYNTADMYTSATRYAAELAQIASIYNSDSYYRASMNGLENILGNFLNQFMESFNFNGYSGAGLVGDLGSAIGDVYEYVNDVVGEIGDFFRGDNEGSSSNRPSLFGNPGNRGTGHAGGTTISGSDGGSHHSGHF